MLLTYSWNQKNVITSSEWSNPETWDGVGGFECSLERTRIHHTCWNRLVWMLQLGLHSGFLVLSVVVGTRNYCVCLGKLIPTERIWYFQWSENILPKWCKLQPWRMCCPGSGPHTAAHLLPDATSPTCLELCKISTCSEDSLKAYYGFWKAFNNV